VPELAYPKVLQDRLAGRYLTQPISVVNAGSGGEFVLDGSGENVNAATVARLVEELERHAPHVLLLQEGINDLNRNDPDLIPAIRDALKTMIATARSRGVQVMLGTLLPERPCSCRAFAPFLVPAANDAIRAMAASEGVPLVDLYEAFAGHEAELLGEDGLHPNAKGYEKMAEQFFHAIQMQFETSTRTRSATTW
jgi:lysophospholipase L1-like esterase